MMIRMTGNCSLRLAKKFSQKFTPMVMSGWDEAIEKLITCELRLGVYLDMNMPRVDGMEILRLLRSEPRFSNVPIFILSTSTTDSMIEKAKSFGATDFLKKPTDYQKFSELLTACFSKHHPK
jgi:CheY-like chemotaxis protein